MRQRFSAVQIHRFSYRPDEEDEHEFATSCVSNSDYSFFSNHILIMKMIQTSSGEYLFRGEYQVIRMVITSYSLTAF